VHARGQVAHVDLPPDPRLTGEVPAEKPWDPSEPPRPALFPGAVVPPPPDTTGEVLTDLLTGGNAMLRRLNGTLAHDIRIRRVSIAPPHFDARFCGVSRTYSYRIADRPEAVDPLRRHDIVHWPRPLDLDLVREASAALVGFHDFAAFCKKREGATTLRTLLRLDWESDATGVLAATVQADAFCHSMVRSLMGALIAVGEGRHPVTWPGSLLSATSRASGVLVAPPHGLTLEHVEYPPDDELAARQATTRRPRA
jgi:tRNA pseudouridine38-40 synthase